MFICKNYDDQYEQGNTLEEAYKNLKENYGDECAFEDCTFWEATELNVEMKIVKKEVPVVVKPNSRK